MHTGRSDERIPNRLRPLRPVDTRRKWANGVDAYLGIASAGFPNALFSYGPQSPAAFCNGPTSAELQGDAIADLLDYLRANGKSRIESTTPADSAWTDEIDQMLSVSLFDQADS
jgi:cation diffusion facilitator CzcD-associated flavoprotein CzcO